MKPEDTLLILFMIIIINHNECNSQGNNKIFIHGGPTLSYRKLVDEYNFDAHPALRYNIGFDFRRSIGCKIEIGSGIIYSKMGYNYESFSYLQTETIHMKYFRNFVEFPFLFCLKIKEQNKNTFLFDINLVNQFIISDELKAKEDEYDNFEGKRNLKDFKESNLRYYNIAVQLGPSYRRELNPSLIFSISPEFKYSLLNMNNIHDWSIGLNIGLGYKF
jgi:hypothetical protein